MTRADVRTFAWMVPLALVLTFWWLFMVVDPCLGSEIGNHWRATHPSVADVASLQLDSGETVVIDNPYGIIACDNFPDAWDHLRTFTILFLIAVLTGFLCARHLQEHARRRAAATAFSLLVLAGAFSQVVYFPRSSYYSERFDYGPLLESSLYVLLLAIGAGAVAWLAASITIRWRARG